MFESKFRILFDSFEAVGETFKEAMKNLISQTKNLRNANIVNKDFNGVDFSNCNLRDSKFKLCTFVGCNFQQADLRGVSSKMCSFESADFRGAILEPELQQFIENSFSSAIFGPPSDGNQ